MNKTKPIPLCKNSLFEADPSANIFNRFPVADHFVGGEIPIGIPDSNGDDNPFGFRYSGEFVQDFRIGDSLVGNAGAQPVVQRYEANVLCYNPYVENRPRIGQ